MVIILSKLNLIFSGEKFEKVPENSIFLAGPTNRENIFETSWRKEAVELFEKYNFNGAIFIPEFRIPKQFSDKSDWEKETEWEWSILDNVSCIMFWIERKSPDRLGLTTNLEFGTYFQKRPQSIALGFPESSENMEWITLRYKTFSGKIPKRTLSETVKEAIQIAKRKDKVYVK